MHGQTGGASFAAQWVSPRLGRNKQLERIDQAVDWTPLARLVRGIHATAEGRASYPPLLMVKALLLEQWYGLSDPRMEEALWNQLDFRRFVGLGLMDDAPDHSTISRFRSALGAERAEALFAEVGRQLDARGLMVKKGTLLDATLVAAQVAPRPLSEGRGATHPLDADASWTKTRRGTRTAFGYKAHVGVDQGTGLVRKAVLTPANVYESEVADALIGWDEGAVYADKAYESKGRRKRLREHRINDRIMHRSHKHQRELPHWQRERNKRIAPIRSAVERVFGTLKRSYGYGRVRYRGLARNRVELLFKVMAYNLRRADVLSLPGARCA